MANSIIITTQDATNPDLGVKVVTIQVPGPVGPQGAPGTDNVLTVGTVTTGAPGTPASASITGTSPSQTLNLTIPQGPQGDAGDITAANTATITGAVDLSDGTYTVALTRVLTLSGNVTFSNLPTTPAAGKSGTLTLVLIQAATGGPYTVNWPSNLIWAQNTAGPVMPTTASYRLMVHLFYDGTRWTGLNMGSGS